MSSLANVLTRVLLLNFLYLSSKALQIIQGVFMSQSSTRPVTDDQVTSINSNLIFAEDAMYEVLLELARNNKGVSDELDQKIDSVAAIIANDKRVNYIAPHNKGAPKVPLYLEGEPGQGKSSLVEAACKKFCELVGLNFIEEPEDSYVFKANDFYYVKVNLSGAQNKSDFGGMLIRTEQDAQEHIKIRRKAANVGSFVLDEILSRGKALAGFSNQMSGNKTTLKQKQFDQGTLEAVELEFSGDPVMIRSIVENLVKQVSEESKEKGVGIHRQKVGAEILDDRVSYSINDGESDSILLTVYAPRTLDLKSEFASAVLPSVRFAKFKKVKFGLVNFDDVANASENIRNILLEVLQKGRYTGTMDIGNAYVVLSGNQGAEDGTNTMSRSSDAEITRYRKLNVVDRPEDWAKRVTAKYTSPVGDCLMASFIHRHGSQPGIFRENKEVKGKRGERKTNSRALENALEVITQHFMAAKQAGISVLQFREKITRDIKDCAGKQVAGAYDAHLFSMVTNAIPLADSLIIDGEWKKSVFETHSDFGRSTSGNDFCFRFGAALADSIASHVDLVSRKSNDDASNFECLSNSIERACTGMANLVDAGQASVMTYSLSHLSRRLASLDKFSIASDGGRLLSDSANKAIARGFAAANSKNVWGSLEKADAAEMNFVKALTGSNRVGAKSGSKNI